MRRVFETRVLRHEGGAALRPRWGGAHRPVGAEVPGLGAGGAPAVWVWGGRALVAENRAFLSPPPFLNVGKTNAVSRAGALPPRALPGGAVGFLPQMLVIQMVEKKNI